MKKIFLMMIAVIAIAFIGFTPLNKISIHGVVKDELGKPVSGALISNLNKTLNTVSDANGSYSITVSAQQETLL